MKNKEQSVLPAVVAFVVVLIICMLVIGGAVCSDGWGSSSIGRSGACSGHGGVRHWPGIIAVIFSAFVALRFHEYLASRNEKPGNPDRIEVQGPSNSLGNSRATSAESSATESKRTRRRIRTYIQCPRCRSKMALRTATRGGNAGGQFWGCSKYPRCKGTRKYEPESQL